MNFDPILDKPDAIVPRSCISSNDNNNTNSRGALLSQIQGGTTLRKVSQSDINTNKNKNKSTDDSRVAINLNDILNARKKLKKKDTSNERPYWR